MNSEPFSLFDALCIGITCITVCFIAAALLTIIIGGLPFIHQAILSPEILFSIRLSLTTSSISTLLCFVCAIPCAYALTHARMPLKRLCHLILELPLSIPYLVLGLCLLMLFSSDAGKWLRDVGIRVIFDPKGIILAQWIINIPFVIRLMYSAFSEIDRRLEYIAISLGATRWQCFRTITLPLTLNAIVMTAVLTWARAMGEFGATLMLAGVTRMKTETLPGSIYLNITTGDNGMAMAAAIMLLGISALTLLTASLLERKKHSHTGMRYT